MNIEFVDAQEMAKIHPATFEAPTAEELDKIEEGKFVKVCNNHERFWVKVVKIDGDYITGDVSNNLFGGDEYGYDFGDKIEFEKRHVYSILED